MVAPAAWRAYGARHETRAPAFKGQIPAVRRSADLPRPLQREHAAVQGRVVLGTAGTGKTTMAMLRAAHLADPRTKNRGPVLLVTYNRTLVTYLKHLRGQIRTDITIETYGKFSCGYLGSMGLMPGWCIARPGQRHKYVENAVTNVASDYRPMLRRPPHQRTGGLMSATGRSCPGSYRRRCRSSLAARPS
jgi:hypothetical protein